MAVFESEEAVREAINNPETPADVFADIMAGNIELGTPEVTEPVEEVVTESEAGVEPQETLETTNTTPEEENVAEDDDLPAETPEEKASRLLAVEKEKLEKEYAAKIAALKTDIPSQQTQAVEPTPEPVKPVIEVEVDTDDAELASSYEKGTRSQLKQLVDLVSGAGVGEDVLKQIEEIKTNQEKILNGTKEAEEKIAREAELNALYSTADEFVKSNPEIGLPVGVREANEAQTTLRGQVAKVFGLTDECEIEKALRGVIRGDSAKSKDLRSKLTAQSIDIPEYMDKYLDVVELDEARRGLEFNKVSGNVELREFTFDEIFRMKNMKKSSQ